MGFKKGESGNPAGRPKGSGSTQKLRKLLEPHAPALVRKVVALAKKGDTAALKLCLERLIPPLKPADEPVPRLKLEGDLTTQASAVLSGLASQELTPGEAEVVMRSIACHARVVETDELERRISELEQKIEARMRMRGVG